MAKSKSKSNHSKKNPNKTHGGGTTADWAQQVVGPYPHSAQNNGTNLIQQNMPMSGGSQLSPALVEQTVNNSVPNTAGSAPILVKSGGKKGKRSNKRKGGDVLAELAVPAVLLVANQTFGRKTGRKSPMGRKRFSRRYRRGRR